MPRKGTNKKHNAKTKKKNKGTDPTDVRVVPLVWICNPDLFPTRRMFDLKTGNPITNGKLRNILIHK